MKSLTLLSARAARCAVDALLRTYIASTRVGGCASAKHEQSLEPQPYW
jgi:hypothetical protein